MNLVLLILITFMFLLINFILADYDYFHPASLFCFIFFIYEVICLVVGKKYAVTIETNTVLVLSAGFFAFTVINYLAMKSDSFHKKKDHISYEYIDIPDIFAYLTILFQLAAIVFFIKYLGAIASAWGQGGNSLADKINLYDTMTKFWTTIFDSLNVPVPIVYRIANPICTAAAYLFLYVTVYNFVFYRKIKISYLVIFILNCFLILLNGSRSPLLRVITMIFLLYYVFRLRKGECKKGSIKTLLKISFAAVFVIVLMFGILFLMGRSEKIGKISTYLFIYTAAPMVNLNNYLASHMIGFFPPDQAVFCEQTFRKIYLYVEKLFGTHIVQNPSVGGFAFSANNIEIGNVYTTYFSFIYDLGYIGVLPLISIVAAYYNISYRNILKFPQDKVIDFRLFIYSYLFNDLIMLPFSSRFYQTVLDAPFIKLIILAWLIDVFFIESRMKEHFRKIFYRE